MGNKISTKSAEAVWIKRVDVQHHIENCKSSTPSIAKWRVTECPGWSYCSEEHFVAALKQYPDDYYDVSEKGQKRRERLRETTAKKEAALSSKEVTPVMDAEKADTAGSALKSATELRELSWMDLKRYAALRGVPNLNTLKRTQILEYLDNDLK